MWIVELRSLYEWPRQCEVHQNCVIAFTIHLNKKHPLDFKILPPKPSTDMVNRINEISNVLVLRSNPAVYSKSKMGVFSRIMGFWLIRFLKRKRITLWIWENNERYNLRFAWQVNDFDCPNKSMAAIVQILSQNFSRTWFMSDSKFYWRIFLLGERPKANRTTSWFQTLKEADTDVKHPLYHLGFNHLHLSNRNTADLLGSAHAVLSQILHGSDEAIQHRRLTGEEHRIIIHDEVASYIGDNGVMSSRGRYKRQVFKVMQALAIYLGIGHPVQKYQSNHLSEMDLGEKPTSPWYLSDSVKVLP